MLTYVRQWYALLLLVVSSNILFMCRADQIATVTPLASTSSTATSSSLSQGVRISTANGFTVINPTKDTLSKRNVKANDLSSSSSISPKSYDDPPPEFYRGPGSTSVSSTSPTYNHRDSATAGFISKPITFPDTVGRNKYGADSSNYLANSYNSWQLLKGSAAGLGTNAASIQDRISVKNYGHPEHSLSGSYGGSPGYGGNAAGYAYEGRPYGGSLGGGGSGGHYIEYAPTPTHYGGGGGGPGAAEYYAGGGSSGESIPFDVYGGNKGHYSGAGGEYSYTYPDLHEPPTHKGHPDLSQKALLAKSFLIPLASAAVLGIAAALVSNPLLLQLGTVSHGIGPAVVGKRKRRDLNLSTTTTAQDEDSAHERRALADAAPEALAYRAHRPSA